MTAQPHYQHNVYVAPLATNDQLREQKLTVQQVAQILDVSKMTVYRLIHAKELRAYRVGHKRHQFRVPISAVRAYLVGAGGEA